MTGDGGVGAGAGSGSFGGQGTSANSAGVAGVPGGLGPSTSASAVGGQVGDVGGTPGDTSISGLSSTIGLPAAIVAQITPEVAVPTALSLFTPIQPPAMLGAVRGFAALAKGTALEGPTDTSASPAGVGGAGIGPPGTAAGEGGDPGIVARVTQPITLVPARTGAVPVAPPPIADDGAALAAEEERRAQQRLASEQRARERAAAEADKLREQQRRASERAEPGIAGAVAPAAARKRFQTTPLGLSGTRFTGRRTGAIALGG